MTSTRLPFRLTQSELTFRLFAISYPDRLKIMRDLELLDETDNGISDGELIKRVIQRAKKDPKQLARLEGAINAATLKE